MNNLSYVGVDKHFLGVLWARGFPRGTGEGSLGGGGVGREGLGGEGVGGGVVGG